MMNILINCTSLFHLVDVQSGLSLKELATLLVLGRVLGVDDDVWVDEVEV
jgi:hypothetical protein